MAILAPWLARQAPAALARTDPRLTPAQRRALTAIARCRTGALGGHVYRCEQCGGRHHGYHSCHHRACPRCGGADTAAWTQRQLDRLLPVPYFLVTFTVPEPVQAAARQRPQIVLDRLFAASAAALQAVADRPKLLGAQLGFVGVLHTWGRQLQWHPHIHYMVPGGGLRADGRKWRRCRAPDYFLPQAALAAAFRARLQAALRATAPDLHAAIPDACWREPWIVDVQPAGTGEAVVKYLARYVKRAAISDERIVRADDDQVVFTYRDSATGQARVAQFAADEFLRRYLQHVPPPGQHRVRYFGWMHPSATARRAVVATLLAVVLVVRAATTPTPWHRRCPHCQAFALVVIGILARGARDPP
jgi:hypothetical protein